MVVTRQETKFYNTEGTLHPEQPSYVERKADNELYQNLIEGHLCYVLASRQVGKSSLMVRTAKHLRAEGWAVAAVDLTSVGKSLSRGQWFFGLLERIGEELDLEYELEDFWNAHRDLGHLQRWMKAIREVVLTRYTGRVAIFLDEIDIVQSLEFSTDEFFGGIRELYQRRAQDPILERLSFCLLGVATPCDLVKDAHQAPFNIGKRIDLNDFNETEAALLTQGLKREESTALLLIRRILHWTGGHPYLTHRLCEAVAGDQEVSKCNGVDKICKDKFLSVHGRETDNNLRFVHQRMLESGGDITRLLSLYINVYSRRRVRADDTDPQVAKLQLSGITRVVKGVLRIRNRIYRDVFNKKWVNKNMPDAEKRRRRADILKGVVRASFAWVLVGLLAAAVTYKSIKEGQQREEAERQKVELTHQLEEMRAAAKVHEQEVELERLRNIKSEEAKKAAQKMAEEEHKRADNMTWQMIKDDLNPLTFKAYIEVYPTGAFKDKAKKRAARSTSSDLFLNGVIRGRVVDADNNNWPIKGAKIKARNQDSPSLEREMDSNEMGEFLIPLLLVGKYTVWISSEGYRTQTLSVTVNKDQICRISPSSSALRKSQ